LSVSECTTTGLATTTYCTTDPILNTIKIGRFTTRPIPVNEKISFTVNSIQNAGIYTSLGDVGIKIYSAFEAEVCTGEYTIPGNSFLQNNITFFDAEVLDPIANYDARYRFTIIPASRVAQYSYMELYLPENITVMDEGEMQS